MADEVQIGGRIKRLRRQRSLTQADFAQMLGISASYLNLIEHNRRKVTVNLLFAIAGRLGIEPGELVESEEGRLTSELMEVFGDDLFADSDLTNLEIRDLAHSNPAAAKAILRLYDRFRAMKGEQHVRDDVDAPFHVATDAISDFLQQNNNHFPALEDVAERIRHDIDQASDDFAHGLRAYLRNVFGIEVRLQSLPLGIARQFDASRNQVHVSDILPAESALFTTVQQLAHLAAGAEIEAIVAGSQLPDGDAPALARNVLGSYLAAALIMPYEPFVRACQAYRYDIDRLGRRFGASFEQVCQRMTTLQRRGAAGVPFHLVRTDIAGNISKRFSLSGIHIPRHSGACPRWNVYTAFMSPDRINVQLSEMPNGDRFFCIARTVTKGDFRHNSPRRYFSIGVGCAIEHATELVYSDGMDLGRADQIVPVGVSCRICPRMECSQRAHPPADHRFRFDESVRPETLYGRMS
jgi:predicted transcriptional regulator/transcriptional regulator with XRE-family HTH domain